MSSCVIGEKNTILKIDFLGKYTLSAVMKISIGQAQTAPSK